MWIRWRVSLLVHESVRSGLKRKLGMIGFVQGGVCLSVMDGCGRPYAEFDSLGNKPVIVCIICLAVKACLSVPLPQLGLRRRPRWC